MNNNSQTGEFTLNSENIETVKTSSDNLTELTVNDEYVIGNGFNLQNYDEPSQAPKKIKKHRKGIGRALIWIACIIVVSITCVILGMSALADYMGLLGETATATVTIEKGESLDSITDELKSVGAIKLKWFFEFYAGSKNYYEKFTEGVHTFSTEGGYQGIINEFTTVPGFSMETVELTIPELASIDDIAKIFDEANICSQADFYDVVENTDFDYKFLDDIPLKSVHYRLEGYLYPDTYEFFVWDSKDGAEQAVKKMLDNFESKMEDDFYAKAEKMGYNFHEILTMASIIELECNGYPDEMPKVSAVFYNRLHNWGPEPKMLGSSPTAEYPYGGGNYDTNKKEGLPPGPLCATGINAIKAALNPEKKFDSKYFYFVTDVDFNFYYNRTLNEHDNTIYNLRMQGKWGED